MILKMRFHKVQPEKYPLRQLENTVFCECLAQDGGNMNLLKNPGILAFEKIRPRIWIVQCKKIY